MPIEKNDGVSVVTAKPSQAAVAEADLVGSRKLAIHARSCACVAGCNKMTCSACGMKFCWICGKGPIDYNHFGTADCQSRVPSRAASHLWFDPRRLPSSLGADVAGASPVCRAA